MITLKSAAFLSMAMGGALLPSQPGHAFPFGPANAQLHQRSPIVEVRNRGCAARRQPFRNAPAPLLDPRSRREGQERLGAAEASLQRAKAAVERARAQATQAGADLTRARTLVERGASTTQVLERS